MEATMDRETLSEMAMIIACIVVATIMGCQSA